MCWCGARAHELEYSCAEYPDFLFDFGSLTVVGPSHGHKATCVQDGICVWSFTDGGLGGYLLSPGDQLMILRRCGTGPRTPGIYNDGIAVTQDGNSFAWASEDCLDLGTVSYADYEMAAASMVNVESAAIIRPDKQAPRSLAAAWRALYQWLALTEAAPVPGYDY